MKRADRFAESERAAAMLLPILLAAEAMEAEAQRVKLWEAATGAAIVALHGFTADERAEINRLRDECMKMSLEMVGNPT